MYFGMLEFGRQLEFWASAREKLQLIYFSYRKANFKIINNIGIFFQYNYNVG